MNNPHASILEHIHMNIGTPLLQFPLTVDDIMMTNTALSNVPKLQSLSFESPTLVGILSGKQVSRIDTTRAVLETQLLLVARQWTHETILLVAHLILARITRSQIDSIEIIHKTEEWADQNMGAIALI